MTLDGDAIADCVLSAFYRLPAKAKPRVHLGGSREWVPLAGIVALREGGDELECISLGTGMRCLPASKIHLARGLCLHDWHAEIVAIRAFNLFLVQECSDLLSDSAEGSKYIRRRSEDEISSLLPQPFALQDHVRLYMYCSEAPCGDASMELTMSSQEDATPWTTLPEGGLLSGRADFSRLGAVRRKPARGDAPPTLSKSCSDKLALKQCTSLLSSATNLLFTPSAAYLHALILPQSQLMPSAVTRAFSVEESGRMRPLLPLKLSSSETRVWPGDYALTPFTTHSTTREFAFSRRQEGSPTASNLAAMWTAHGKQEVLIGGTVQGHKQFSMRGASAICKASMLRTVFAVLGSIATLSPELRSLLAAGTYQDVKQSDILKSRRKVKEDVREEVLKGWVRNDGDEDFALKV